MLTTFIVTEPDQPTGQVTTPVPELMADVNSVPDVLVIPLNDHDKVPTEAVLL